VILKVHIFAGWQDLTQWTCCYFSRRTISLSLPRRWDTFNVRAIAIEYVLQF